MADDEFERDGVYWTLVHLFGPGTSFIVDDIGTFRTAKDSEYFFFIDSEKYGPFLTKEQAIAEYRKIKGV